MKITCPFCGSKFNDTLEQCPYCAAPNEGVVRKSTGQPVTIEELKQWYADRKLPPYETTRFFIGENYQKPRAFGIYQDPSTGNFVVYKNKDSGQRAIRYEGTDEAYAVNELYQRLKQEILQQKSANLAKKGGNTPAKAQQKSGVLQKNKILAWIIGILMIPVVFILLCFAIVFVTDPPEDGYYQYADGIYYAMDTSDVPGGPNGINTMYWFSYDDREAEWSRISTKAELPGSLYKKRKAKEYFLSEGWSESYGVPSIMDSVAYDDLIHLYAVGSGYYQYGNRTFYHLTNYADSGWYYYDDRNDWQEIDDYDLPEELRHSSSAGDFYDTYEWDSSTQVTDFADSTAYEEYLEEEQRAAEEAKKWDDDDSSSFDWDFGSDWDSGGTDFGSDW